MRGRMVAVVAAATLVAATLTVTAAVAVSRIDDDSVQVRRHGMMSGAGSWSGMGSMMASVGVDSEYDYLTEMVAHHHEAVAAAEELARSDRPEMRAFGESIVGTQSAQIGQMQSWLARWYPDESDRADYQPMMRDLSGLSGDQLDAAFLQDMIWHHMAAVMMSQQLLATGVPIHPEVADLARTIRDDQHAEILRMQQWGSEWFGQGWRHGSPNGWSGRSMMGQDMMGWLTG